MDELEKIIECRRAINGWRKMIDEADGEDVFDIELLKSILAPPLVKLKQSVNEPTVDRQALGLVYVLTRFQRAGIVSEEQYEFVGELFHLLECYIAGDIFGKIDGIMDRMRELVGQFQS